YTSFRVIVNTVRIRWIQGSRVLIPIVGVSDIKSSVGANKSRRDGVCGIRRANSRRVVAVFHTLLTAERVSHFDPANRAGPAARKTCYAIRSDETNDRISAACVDKF